MTEVTVNGDGSSTLGSVGAPGAGGYTSGGDGSIAANGPHTPFLDQTATFTDGNGCYVIDKCYGGDKGAKTRCRANTVAKTVSQNFTGEFIKIMKKTLLTILLAGTAVVVPSYASTIIFSTSVGAMDTAGEQVDATASVTTGASGLVTVTLTDLEANPRSAGQLLSDFSFTISSPIASALNTTTTPTGTLVFVGQPVVATAIASWGLTSTGTTLTLDSLLGGPSQTIIGPGPYTNANSSITGSSHNPYLNQTATFSFTVSGVTAATTVSAASFSFGTSSDDHVAGVDPLNSAPEPGTVLMSLIGIAMIGVSRFKKLV